MKTLNIAVTITDGTDAVDLKSASAMTLTDFIGVLENVRLDVVGGEPETIKRNLELVKSAWGKVTSFESLEIDPANPELPPGFDLYAEVSKSGQAKIFAPDPKDPGTWEHKHTFPTTKPISLERTAPAKANRLPSRVNIRKRSK